MSALAMIAYGDGRFGGRTSLRVGDVPAVPVVVEVAAVSAAALH